MKDVNQTNEPIHIPGNNEESESVMVSKKTGSLFKDIDWDTL
ncbi:MAG: hypothetical protein ABS916_07745 [Carnobacterium sp.]